MTAHDGIIDDTEQLLSIQDIHSVKNAPKAAPPPPPPKPDETKGSAAPVDPERERATVMIDRGGRRKQLLWGVAAFAIVGAIMAIGLFARSAIGSDAGDASSAVAAGSAEDEALAVIEVVPDAPVAEETPAAPAAPAAAAMDKASRACDGLPSKQWAACVSARWSEMRAIVIAQEEKIEALEAAAPSTTIPWIVVAIGGILLCLAGVVFGRRTRKGAPAEAKAATEVENLDG